MIEPIPKRRLHKARRFDGRQFFLGLSLELRLAQENGKLDGTWTEEVLCYDLRCTTVASLLAPRTQPLQQGRAKPSLMCAALCRWDGVAIGMDEAFHFLQPCDSPFCPPSAAREIGL